MGRLTTHVLDTANGCPAAQLKIELYRLDAARTRLLEVRTNTDGRLDQPLLEGDDLQPGEYELVFYANDYFTARSTPVDDPPFINQVVIRFGIAHSNQHYHVPLLVSPWSYSTYRGS